MICTSTNTEKHKHGSKNTTGTLTKEVMHNTISVATTSDPMCPMVWQGQIDDDDDDDDDDDGTFV